MLCSKCVLPSTTPGIEFDEHGVCNHCNKFVSTSFKGEDALLAAIDKFRGNGTYDAIVTLSGGRDSSFTILKAVKDYKMKVLAFNYRNPFTHPTAIQNIKRIKEILGIELIQFDLPGDLHVRSMRHNLISWMKNPSLAMVPIMCVACKVMWKPVLKIAHERGIKMAFSGSNPYEQNSFKRELLGISAQASTAYYYTAYIFGIMKEVLKNLRYFAPEVLPPTILGYLYSGPEAPLVKYSGRNLQKVTLFNYIPWDEETVLTRIKNELGWESPIDSTTTWRFDCIVDDLKNYIYQELLGVTEKEDFYSNLMRAGLIDRSEALNRVRVESEVNIEKVKEVLDKVGVQFDDFKRVLDSYKRNRS